MIAAHVVAPPRFGTSGNALGSYPERSAARRTAFRGALSPIALRWARSTIAGRQRARGIGCGGGRARRQPQPRSRAAGGGAIDAAVSDGTLPRARLEEAFARVQRLRERRAAAAAREFPPHPGVGREIARRGVTLARIRARRSARRDRRLLRRARTHVDARGARAGASAAVARPRGGEWNGPSQMLAQATAAR